jgi:hypothetical protein
MSEPEDAPERCDVCGDLKVYRAYAWQMRVCDGCQEEIEFRGNAEAGGGRVSAGKEAARRIHTAMEGWEEHPVLAWHCHTCERLALALEMEKASRSWNVPEGSVPLGRPGVYAAPERNVCRKCGGTGKAKR